MRKMVSSLSNQKSTGKGRQQLEIGYAKPIQGNSPFNPVDFEAIAANAPKGKEPKSLRVEKRLLMKTEALREQTNLSFNEYVETALTYFNACLDQHLVAQSTEQTGDTA